MISTWPLRRERRSFALEVPCLENSMSRLTALEIKKKEFEQKMRGADPEAVQAFLDQVSTEVETLTLEKREMEEVLLKTREKLEHYTALESTIEKTLAAAQQTAVTMAEQGKKDVGLILR